MATPACLRCQGRMEAGFTTDHNHGMATVSPWVEGTPEKSMWTGLKLRGRRQLPIATWRCTRCGWLESYAAG